MTIQLTHDGLRRIMGPGCPQPVIDYMVSKQAIFDKAGITANRNRLAICLANVEHETSGFSIPNLTESINYSHARVAEVWPNRFTSAVAVRNKYGSDVPGWRLRMLDDIYGNRMGNGPPSTHDGSNYRGRGGPQVTGKDGYKQVADRTGKFGQHVPIDQNPELATKAEWQPEIIAAFWDWKGMNMIADTQGVVGVRKRWNGGTNGLGDTRARLAGNQAAIDALPLKTKLTTLPQVKTLPGTVEKPDSAVKEATKTERRTRDTAATIGTATGANEAGKATNAPSVPMPPYLAYAIVAVAVGLVAFSMYKAAKTKALILKDWFA